ncbi:MAG TPA: hypothetical protein VE153_10975 [Myxococcus sp.]|nr:hypothetical protein [Myxococcus sp.]
MPPSAKPSTPPAQELPAPSYPSIESLLETVSLQEAQDFFAPVKTELEALKGPRAEQGKRAQAALARAEELLVLLVETRERLLADAKGGAKGRK